MPTYFPYAYFFPPYFLALGMPAASSIVQASDFEIFANIEQRLVQSGRFASIAFPGARGPAAACHQPMPSVSLAPVSWTEVDDADHRALLRTARYELTIAVWSPDLRSAYEQLDRLANLCQNLLDGSSLDGLVLAARSRLSGGTTDLDSTHPAKRVNLSGEFTRVVARDPGRPT
jgi:hypothetical protein